MSRLCAINLAGKLGIVFGGLVLSLAALDLLLDAVPGTAIHHDHKVRIVVLGAVLVVAGIVFLSRLVIRPMQKLTEAADIMSAGHLDHRIEIDRQDELGRLARAFNTMAERLHGAYGQLNETNARLEAEVADRTAELAMANERLQRELRLRQETEQALRLAKEAAESANDTKTLFLANMSHELRTPLHAIIGFAEILENQLFGPLGSDRYRTYVSDIRESGSHLLKLINEILDVSRIEAGAFELDEDSFDPLATIETCFQMVDHRARAQGVRLRQSLAPDLPFLRGDEVRIKQILVNLLDNGIKFTPEGGLVSLEALLLPDGAVSIRVVDTGVGIAEGDLAKVLSVFGQADSSFTRKHDGAGLGLPLAKALVEKHGGAFSIESEPGTGTRITLTFPADRVVPRRTTSVAVGDE